MPNFAELWPENNPMGKRRQIGLDYYLDALKHNGLTGHLPQPDNFTTCGKMGIESRGFQCPGPSILSLSEGWPLKLV